MELIFEYPFFFIIVRNFFLNIWRYKRQINFPLSLIPNPQLVAVISQELFYLCLPFVLSVRDPFYWWYQIIFLWPSPSSYGDVTETCISTACNCKYWTSVHVLKNFVHVLYTRSSLPILVNNLWFSWKNCSQSKNWLQ